MHFEKLLNNIVQDTLNKLAGVSQATPASNESDIEKVASGLIKVASMGSDELIKVADAVRGIAKYASDTISIMQGEKKAMLDKIATYEKSVQVRTIVEDMIEKGALAKSDAGTKIKELMTKSAFDIEVHKKALEMFKSAGSSSGAQFGTLEEGVSSGGRRVNPMEDVVMNSY